MQVDVMPDGFDVDLLEVSQMEQAAILLLGGSTHDAVARELGIHRTTLFRWKRDPAWRDIFGKAQAEVIGSARVRLVGMVHKALDKLERLQEDSSGKGAPTEASIAWGVLDRVGVEVQVQQAEGVRRILTRVPRELPASAPPVVEAVEEPASEPTSGPSDRPAVRIVSKRGA